MDRSCCHAASQTDPEKWAISSFVNDLQVRAEYDPRWVVSEAFTLACSYLYTPVLCSVKCFIDVFSQKYRRSTWSYSKSSVACDLGINYSYSYRNIGGTTLSKDLKIRGKIDSFRMWHSLEEGVGDGR